MSAKERNFLGALAYNGDETGMNFTVVRMDVYGCVGPPREGIIGHWSLEKTEHVATIT